MKQSTRIGIGLVLALAATLGLVAVVVAGVGGNRFAAGALATGYDSPAQTLHRVAAPSGTVGGASLARPSAKRAKPVKVAYYETNLVPVAENEAVGDSLPCPGKRRVLGGYFASNGTDLALTFSGAESPKRWFVGVTNLPGSAGGTDTSQAILGIVCAKGVG